MKEIMNIELEVDPWLAQDNTVHEVQKILTNGMILVQYLKGEVSISEIAEHQQTNVEEVMQWLGRMGINTTLDIGDELRAITHENMKQQLADRGISYP